MEVLLNNAGVSEITHLTQYLKNRLYFATVSGKAPKSTQDAHFFTIDDELGKKVIHYTSSDLNKRANAAFLISSYAVLYLAQSPSEAFYTAKYRGKPFKPFQDASQRDSIYHISILDCLQALHRAVTLRFFNFMDFDCPEFDKLSKVGFGDISWIVPGKFIAFPGPVDLPNQDQTTDLYVKYFLKNNVTTVIRLNRPQYDTQKFTDVGISHYELFFPDGTTPPRQILLDFLNIAENEPGVIAVHCKAGLGRTGTLIAAYLIKHYDMGARESIAWLRLCRPGCVIGPQQAWLEQAEGWLWKEGCNYRIMMHGEGDKLPCHRYGIYSIAKKKRASIRADEARIAGVLQEKRQLLNQIDNNEFLNNNRSLLSSNAETSSHDATEHFKDNQNENQPSANAIKKMSFSPSILQSNLNEQQSNAAPVVQLYDRENEKLMTQNPIIVMPAMLSVKHSQKYSPSSRSKYMVVPNASENRYAGASDDKERNLKKLGSPASRMHQVNSAALAECKQNSETSQGQRLLDLKKEREKQFYRNKGVADIRLLSQASMPNRHKGHK